MNGFRKDCQELTVRLDEIGEEGYRLSCTRSVQWVRELVADAKGIDWTCIGDLSIELTIYRVGREIFLRGQLHTLVRVACVRCMEEFELPLEVEFNYTLSPPGKGSLVSEVEISKEDLDLLVYQGDSIDLAQLAREQILVSIPLYPRCKESCRGICPRCGRNLNHDSCECYGEEGTISKFEMLRKFYIKH